MSTKRILVQAGAMVARAIVATPCVWAATRATCGPRRACLGAAGRRSRCSAGALLVAVRVRPTNCRNDKLCECDHGRIMRADAVCAWH